ncbi:MAG: hypothetical protein Q7S62_02140 [bacterium]|nr:hypothetical protein [bacterium]
MNSRNSQILIGVLLILVVGGVFVWQYLGTPKEEAKDETADWNIYRNELLGFSLKVPLEYQRSYEEPQASYPVYKLYTDDKEQAIEEKGGKLVASQISIVFAPVGGVTLAQIRKSIEELRVLNAGEKIQEDEAFEKIGNKDIDGCKGVTFQQLDSLQSRLVFSCLLEVDVDEATYVTTTLSSRSEFIGKYKEIYDKILSTFQFVEK